MTRSLTGEYIETQSKVFPFSSVFGTMQMSDLNVRLLRCETIKRHLLRNRRLDFVTERETLPLLPPPHKDGWKRKNRLQS